MSFALGTRTMETMESAGIRQTAWRWRYNPSIPRPTGPYPPHRSLAGAHLNTLPSPDGFYPGDHSGCRCSAEPVLRGPDGRFAQPPPEPPLEDYPETELSIDPAEARAYADDVHRQFEEAANRCANV